MPFSLVRAPDLEPGPPIDWLWDGYIATSLMSFFSGYQKVGKTTLLRHLLDYFGGNVNDNLLGTEVRAAEVIYVSEEHPTLWYNRQQEQPLGSHVRFAIRPFSRIPSREIWDEFVDELAEEVRGKERQLVIFDTFANLAPAYEENKAEHARIIMHALYRLTDAGAGVLLIHHERKAGGDLLSASRGSGQHQTPADIVLQLSRYNPDLRDRRRKISAISRISEATPLEMVIELSEDGEKYHTIGEPIGPAAQLDSIHRVRSLLPGPEEKVGRTIEEILGLSPPCSQKTLRKLLDDGIELGMIKQEGKGKRGDPYCYSQARAKA